ncbi:glycosyltransferase family 2 protein [Sphingobacterium bambusae]|uniref:Glycosyltransferase family 2 protein n=1 Tax=Sphingobacterium bambusae TaxID=662858 RepID=A0ABW6BI76_9SPHI|nr:glycosyltransferase family 2 protein [Sphingobacterium bambusae]WPL47382.1 glycosyltransferase family 2 protein [Sphingobacterium bambusae]
MISSSKLSPGVSIVICSFNGGHKLIPTLEHIAAQEPIEKGQLELLYVDNGSTDQSLEIVRETWSNLKPAHIQLTIIEESTPGKYFALDAALAKAKFNCFIICDDDNWLNKDYAKRVFSTLSEHPTIGAIGGKSIATFQTENPTVPTWFLQDRQRYAIGGQGEKTGDVTYRKQLWGAGMGSRTLLYQSFYSKYPSAFLLQSDNEKGHFVAEDTEYCLRLILRGYKLHYDETLLLQHYVPTDRLSAEYNNKLNRQIEGAFIIIEKLNLATKLFGSLSYSAFGILRLKLLTPLRKLISSNKIRHQILSNLLFPSKTNQDIVIEQIRSFAKDPALPFATKNAD